MTETTEYRATYRQHGIGWEGIVKNGSGDVVSACGHIHRNRDTGSHTNGPSARSCAWELLAGIIGSEATAVLRTPWAAAATTGREGR